MSYDYSRWDKLSDDEIWALNVRESYNQQLEDGDDEARFSEIDRWAMPGGDCLEELGKLGLQLAIYENGIYIEPDSRYPKHPADLVQYEEEVA